MLLWRSWMRKQLKYFMEWKVLWKPINYYCTFRNRPSTWSLKGASEVMVATQNCSLNMQNFPFITLLGHKISIHPVCCLSVSLSHKQVAWELESWSLIWRITKSTWSLSSPLMSLARHKGERIKPFFLNTPLRQLQSDSYSPSAQQSFGEKLNFRS